MNIVFESRDVLVVRDCVWSLMLFWDWVMVQYTLLFSFSNKCQCTLSIWFFHFDKMFFPLHFFSFKMFCQTVFTSVCWWIWRCFQGFWEEKRDFYFIFLSTLFLFFLTAHSGGKACGRHALGHGHAVCPGEERSEDVPSDPLQPLPQDQCEAGRHQQHPGASPTVGHHFLLDTLP